MKPILSIALLWLTLSPPIQNWPEEYYRIPEQLRDSATVVVAGTFGQGRTPCMYMPDGTRVWFIDSWFKVQEVYRGEVRSQFIRVNTAMLPESEYVPAKLEWDHNYLVLLRPDHLALKALKTKEGISFQDSLSREEIVAIVELK